ncbi:hypothetical protein [Chroococcus sp. FPU101]|uniref:hypothetical protein n=1 Tax=Chroococcus sp. FPU101 TaxID=1974212 RepID=UPI001A8FFC98|nr:hypothetical protein [Chroococcus sp. FPU101]GFE72036.1 hypothetical protein CFPU101_46460 [Chroococcus sp. FPU101]
MYELPINRRKFKSLVEQARHYNIYPIYLPNYLFPLNQHPISELMGELVDEAFSYLSCSTDTEIEQLISSFPDGVFMMLGRNSKWDNDHQKNRLAVYYIVTEVQRSYLSFKKVVNQSNENSKVFEIYPELKNKLDKDNLLYIDDNFTLMEGGIEYKNHILHYHQFLRRGYSSNPNFNFLGALQAFYMFTKTKNQFRIAIDHQRIMPKDFYQQIIELDTWYGVPFDEENLDEQNSVGLAIVKRNENSLFEPEGISLDRIEFF